MARTQHIGVISKELAVNSGITGPMLRATGVNYDIRKVDKYGIYERFDFRVPLGQHGDVFDRYMCRLLEMRESLKILEQAIRDIPAGPIMDPNRRFAVFGPKAGEAYGRIEAPKGELGFYLISDGSAILIVTVCGRQALSTSRCLRICASATTLRTPSRFLEASILC